MQQITKLNNGYLENYFQENPYCHQLFQNLNDDWQTRFLDYCQGTKTLPLTYDPFFKRIFHPDVHPERLERLISSLLGINVKIKGILPTEDLIISNDSMMIMDILAELEDGSLANVEIQKIPYLFPAERMSCYSSDLVLRQYSRVKGELGKQFTYKDIKKVYTIVIYEKTEAIFHKLSPTYIHHGKTTFDSNLCLELLQEYCLIALDVFKQTSYSKGTNERDAWIGLLATENISDANRLIRQFPFLEEIYIEMSGYMNNIEEVLSMFSDSLNILNRNTMHYMVDEMQEKIDTQASTIDEQASAIDEQASTIDEQAKLIKQLQEELLLSTQNSK